MRTHCRWPGESKTTAIGMTSVSRNWTR
jgi:hypothetical protein